MLIMGNFLMLIIIPYNYWYYNYKELMLDDRKKIERTTIWTLDF